VSQGVARGATLPQNAAPDRVTVELVVRLQRLVEAELGLVIDQATAAIVLARHPLGLVDRLAAEPERVQHLAPEVTIGDTYFYRHAEQLLTFRDVALPDCLSRGGRVRVLSAGCSTGEEPYTLAMLAARHDQVQITGLDVNAVALARAAQARYPRWSLRALPADLELRWFTRKGDDYAFAPELSGTVVLRRANLAAACEPPAGAFDIIFCRNVVRYFEDAAARAVLDRLVRALAPGGYLFLGDGEHVEQLPRHESNGASYYQLTA
jgi:chemotaxis protein methyltransferase CheR